MRGQASIRPAAKAGKWIEERKEGPREGAATGSTLFLFLVHYLEGALRRAGPPARAHLPVAGFKAAAPRPGRKGGEDELAGLVPHFPLHEGGQSEGRARSVAEGNRGMKMT